MKRGFTGLNREINFPWAETIEVMKPDGENLSVTVRADRK